MMPKPTVKAAYNYVWRLIEERYMRKKAGRRRSYKKVIRRAERAEEKREIYEEMNDG